MRRAALHDPLVERARRAERKILEEIDSFLSSVLTVYDRPLILRRLERDSKARAKGIMTSFGAYAKRWENKELQAFYEEQVGKAGREMRKAGIDLKRALLGEIDPEELHGRAYGTIRDEFSSRFSDLLTLVSRQTGDIYTQVQRQSARFAFMETDDVKATIRGMRRRFMETGMYDLGFRDKSGRIWHMDAYTDMVGRTVTANARRTAMEMEFLAHGENLVRLSYHPTKCAMCAPWNGVIVALMEPTKDYPYTLQDAYESGWGHPNCLHGFTLYVEGFSDPGPSEPSMTTEDKDEPYKPPKPGKLRPEIGIVRKNGKEAPFKDQPLPKLLKEGAGRELRDVFENSPAFIQKKYLEHKDSLNGMVHDLSTRQSFYSPAKKSITLGLGSRLTTIPHEFGHHVDYMDGKKIGVLSVSMMKEFKQAITEARKSFTGKAQSTVEKKAHMVRLMQGKMGKIPGVSDIFDGLSRGKIKGEYCHKPKYWKQPGKIEQEIFANLFQLHAQNDQEGIDCINALFPDIINSFLQLLGGK